MPEIHPRDREQRATWRWRADRLVRRGAAFVIEAGGPAVRLNYNHVAAGNRLLDFGAGTGRVYPSHATLANRIGKSIETVQTALKLLAAAGLLAWAHTWIPNPDGFAGAKMRGPNVYAFALPDEGAVPPYKQENPRALNLLKKRNACDEAPGRNHGGPVRQPSVQDQLAAFGADAAGAAERLAARRRAFEAEQAARYANRRAAA